MEGALRGDRQLTRQGFHRRAEALITAQLRELFAAGLPEPGDGVLTDGRHAAAVGAHGHAGHRTTVGIRRDHMPIGDTDPPGDPVSASGHHLSAITGEGSDSRHPAAMNGILVEPRSRAPRGQRPAPAAVGRRRDDPSRSTGRAPEEGQLGDRLDVICEAFEERAGGGVVDEDRRSRPPDGGDDPLPVVRPRKRRHLAAEVANAVDPKRPPLRLPEAERTIDRPGGEAVVVGHGERPDRHAMADREQPLP